MASYDELLNELRTMGVTNDDALIDWFYRAFLKASDEKVAELPGREEVANIVASERHMLPNFDLPDQPLNVGVKGGAALAAWLVQRGLNLAVTPAMPDVPLSFAYWQYVEVARGYLGYA